MNSLEIVEDFVERYNKQDKNKEVANAIIDLANEIKKYQELCFLCEDCGDAVSKDGWEKLDFPGQLCEDCQDKEMKDQNDKDRTMEAGLR